MDHKWIGAGLIFLACGGFGIFSARLHRKEAAALRELMNVLDFMECQLQYRLTPLPELCRQAAGQAGGLVHHLFLSLAEELESQILPEVSGCMHAALSRNPDLPSQIRHLAGKLGRTLGQFDLSGQLRGLENLRLECGRLLEDLRKNQDTRLRSYQTLGFCAGAALAVLFI